MTRTEIINKAIENNEITTDVAGQIMMLGESAVRKALENNEISLDLAGQIMMAN